MKLVPYTVCGVKNAVSKKTDKPYKIVYATRKIHTDYGVGNEYATYYTNKEVKINDSVKLIYTEKGYKEVEIET